ncbi:jg10447 [Pararge aegeria aegeria]|uniref:Jg10447 protein n=1 Tax=Pararge aegeria aegeria TaxID=348720 RepID=A0A8S4RE90_9NEOP|nr:jg10447 [Pararge aegeria aegeria]
MGHHRLETEQYLAGPARNTFRKVPSRGYQPEVQMIILMIMKIHQQPPSDMNTEMLRGSRNNYGSGRGIIINVKTGSLPTPRHLDDKKSKFEFYCPPQPANEFTVNP